MRQDVKQYINGEWVDSHSGQTLDVINPATEEVAGKIAAGNKEDVDDAVAELEAAIAAFNAAKQEAVDEEEIEEAGEGEEPAEGEEAEE